MSRPYKKKERRRPPKKKFSFEEVPSKNKAIEATRQLDATIPGKDKTPFTCPKCGRDSCHPKDKEERYCGACGFVGDAFKCFLCDAPIQQKDVKDQFCHGCRKLICNNHDGGIPMGGHAPEAHEISDMEEDQALEDE